MSDSGELERLARIAIAANVGQVMKASGGKADPAALRDIMTRLLG